MSVIYRVDRGLKLVWIDGREIKLTPNRWELFVYLLDNNDRYVSTDELWKALWGDEYQRGVVKWQAAQLRRDIQPVVLEHRSHHGWRLHI